MDGVKGEREKGRKLGRWMINLSSELDRPPRVMWARTGLVRQPALGLAGHAYTIIFVMYFNNICTTLPQTTKRLIFICSIMFVDFDNKVKVFTKA